MPCNSDYLNPTQREAELARTAKLMVYLNGVLGRTSDAALQKAARSAYGGADYVPGLCRTIRELSPDMVERIVYNAHDRTARDLADWWEDHQKADTEREAAELLKMG